MMCERQYPTLVNSLVFLKTLLTALKRAPFACFQHICYPAFTSSNPQELVAVDRNNLAVLLSCKQVSVFLSKTQTPKVLTNCTEANLKVFLKSVNLK